MKACEWVQPVYTDSIGTTQRNVVGLEVCVDNAQAMQIYCKLSSISDHQQLMQRRVLTFNCFDELVCNLAKLSARERSKTAITPDEIEERVVA